MNAAPEPWIRGPLTSQTGDESSVRPRPPRALPELLPVRASGNIAPVGSPPTPNQTGGHHERTNAPRMD